MNVKNVKKEPERFDVIDDLSLEIQRYGSDNLYPQAIRKIASASGTCSSCIDTYSKFIEGKGFKDNVFYKSSVNDRGVTIDSLLSLHSKDIAFYKGFALHVNYNLLAEITEVQFLPFENCRFGLEDELGYVSKIAVHKDWGGVRSRTKKKGITKTTIDYIDVFNPIKNVVLAQIIKAGGVDKYKGQVLYYSFDGDFIYPKAKYDSIITDASTEAGLSNVNYRNVRHNFLPAGMLIRKKTTDVDLTSDSGDKWRNDDDTFTSSFKQFQGDENACKIIDVEIEFDEEKPEFVPFETQNISEKYSATKKDIQDNIGKVFIQPPILRAEMVSTGFTQEAIKDAYNFYNSITDPERRTIERIYKQVFERFFIDICPSKDFSILPLKYITDEQKIDNVS